MRAEPKRREAPPNAAAAVRNGLFRQDVSYFLQYAAQGDAAVYGNFFYTMPAQRDPG